MSIPIVWKEYTYVMSGGTYKCVRCEQCKQKYVYRMIRQVQGQGNSLYLLDNAGAENRAKSNAQAELTKQLDNDCDPVPCPGCGWYQVNMVAKIRAEYKEWMYWTGLVLLFPVIFLAAIAWISYHRTPPNPNLSVLLLIIGACVVLASALMIFGRIWLANRVEPNQIPAEERIYLGQGKAEIVDDFEKWLRDQGELPPG